MLSPVVEQKVPLFLRALFGGVEQNVPQHAQALITSFEGGEQNVPHILRARSLVVWNKMFHIMHRRLLLAWSVRF